ncbi:MAG: GDSL-type esterase/lipase family protein [Pseudomonadota bacterium]|nr:GDSL-type esterase/lipase family protein [Pseudomonadota bacterium]
MTPTRFAARLGASLVLAGAVVFALSTGEESAAATPVVAAASEAPVSVVAPRVEPAWVLRYDVPAGTLPVDECASTGKIESPGVKSPPPPTPPPTPPDEPAKPPAETAGMLRVDTTPGAKNEELPEPIRTRLGFGAPFDVATIAPEPLRGRPEDLARVRAVLAKAAKKEGHTRLSFWGASHVAGEYFTGELRRILQDRYGDAGHGFVMPAAPWTGYRVTDTNLCTGGAWTSDFHNRKGGRDDGLFGPGGMSVEALAPTSYGWVQTTKTNPHGRAVSRFEVLYLRQPGGGELDVHVDDAAPIRIPTGAPMGVTGPGAAVLTVPDGAHRLAVSAAGDGPVRVFGVHMERDAPGVIIDAMGVSGRTAASWLAWDAGLQAAYLDRRPVDLAVLAYGTNEANDRGLSEDEYRATLRKVLTRMRRVLPDAACVLIGPSDRGRHVSRATYAIWGPTAWVARTQREIAPEFGCVSWDLQEATGGPGSMLRWWGNTPALAAGDLIHFTAAGYRELATRFVTALDGA